MIVLLQNIARINLQYDIMLLFYHFYQITLEGFKCWELKDPTQLSPTRAWEKGLA